MYLTEDPDYTKPPDNGMCPMSLPGEEWLDGGDSCYLYIENYVNFADARHECYIR